MKNRPPSFAACLFGLLLLNACDTGSADATAKTTDQIQENRSEINNANAEGHEEWHNERAEAIKELRELRGTLMDQQASEQKLLDAGIKDAERKSECVAMIAELGSNIARIDASLLKLEATTGTDWSSVKAEARRTADDTKSWWSRQRELIDKKTDADNDNDGH
jgi:hypothetical protein